MEGNFHPLCTDTLGKRKFSSIPLLLDSSVSDSDMSESDLDEDEDVVASEDDSEDEKPGGRRLPQPTAPRDEKKKVAVQSLVPADEYGQNLGQAALRGKKRKAAWKDEADSEVRVKDVTKSYR